MWYLRYAQVVLPELLPSPFPAVEHAAHGAGGGQVRGGASPHRGGGEPRRPRDESHPAI